MQLPLVRKKICFYSKILDMLDEYTVLILTDKPEFFKTKFEKQKK